MLLIYSKIKNKPPQTNSLPFHPVFCIHSLSNISTLKKLPQATENPDCQKPDCWPNKTFPGLRSIDLHLPKGWNMNIEQHPLQT